MPNKFPINATGICHIVDKDTKQVILHEHNAIHFGNLVVALSLSLVGDDDHNATIMAFGNGATSVTPDGRILYRSKNVSDVYDTTADIYSPIYNKSFTGLGGEPVDDFNNVSAEISGSNFVDLNFFVTLDYGEPTGQDLVAEAQDLSDPFVFDELGIKTTNGLLLSHVIHSPVQKALNRAFEIEYTIRLQMS